MTVLQAIVLALIQGFTEFLPISSSAHLILPSALIEDWPDQGIYFDITVHIGTLGAVIIYFRKMLLMMLKESIAWVVKKRAENRKCKYVYLYHRSNHSYWYLRYSL